MFIGGFEFFFEILKTDVSKMDNGENTPLSFLETLDDPVVKELLPFISGKFKKSDLNEAKKHNITFFLIVFRDTYPAEFYMLIAEIQKLTELTGIEMMHSLIGPEIVSFFDKIPKNFWKSIDVDMNQLPTYFNFPQTFQQKDSFYELQEILTKKYEFPATFPDVFNGDKFSFANTSVVKKKHFVDLVFSPFFESIISGDYSSVEEQCHYLPDLSAYFIASQRDILYADLSMCIELFGMQHPKSIASEMLERYKGDYEITQMLSFLSKTDVCTGDIEANSVPYILSEVIMDQSIHQFRMPPSFLISDKDATNDMDFIAGFWSIKSVLENINKPSSLPLVEKYLAQIKDVNFREKIVTDIFSFLFIRNKDNYFMCVPLFAEAILSVLMKYSDNEYIATGFSLLSSVHPKTLLELFNKDRSGVFFAMDEKDWEKAYALAGQTKYRKMVDLAKEVNLVVTGGSSSTNKQVLLESGLSTFSKWSEIEAPDKENELIVQLLKQRSKATSESFDVLPETEKWTPSSTFVEMFETDGLEMIASGHANLYINTIHGERLSSFIKYCSLYYKCASLSNFEFSSLTSGFGFDMKRALSGPVNCGSIDLASQLANICGIDLFMFILMHQKDFEITPELINFFIEQYPMEAAALALSGNMSKDAIRNLKNVPKIFSRFSDERELSTYEDLDDTLFNSDHYEILKKLLAKNIEELTDEDIYVLDVVSYSAKTKEEEKTVDIIMSTHVIFKEFKSAPETNSEIVEKLVFMNELQKAIRYTKAVNEDNVIMKLVEVCQKNAVEEVLTAFADKYELFIPLCVSKPCLIPSVLKIARGKAKTFLENLSLLPPSLIHNYKNKNELVAFFSQSIEKVLLFRKEFLNFVGDEEVFAICRSFVETDSFMKCLLHMVRFMKDKAKLSNWWCNYIITKTKQKIRTAEDEEKLIKYFYSIEPMLDYFSSLKLDVTEIKMMHDLVIQKLFRRIGSYDFSPETLLLICHLTDQEDTAIECGKLFDISLGQFYLQRAHAAIILGLFNTARDYVNRSGESVSSFKSHENCSIISTSFLEPLNFPPTFDIIAHQSIMLVPPKEIAKSRLPPQHIYNLISNSYNALINKVQGKTITGQTSEQRKELRFYMSNHMESKYAIPILTFKKQYDRVYQLLMSISDDQEREECFIKGVFFVAASNEKELTKLVNFVLSQDQNLFITRNLWDALIDFTKKRDMLHTLFHIYMFRNQLEDLASTSIALMKTAVGVEQNICLLGHANAALTECELCRQKKMALTPPYIASSATMEQITQQKQVVDLLLNFCIFCESHPDTVKYSSKYDILHNDAAYTEIMYTLIEQMDDGMIKSVFEVVPELRYTMSDVYDRIAKLPINKLMEIINHFKNSNISPEFFESLTTGTMKSISMTKNWASIMCLIMIAKSDPREQCTLFIEYDFLAEAYQSADNNGLDDMFPLIAHRCAQVGSLQVLQNCMLHLQ